MSKHNKRIIFIFLIVALLGMLALMTGCNPVKKVLNDEGKMRQVWEKGVLKDWCINDSVYISDTTVILDTLNVIETVSDTVQIGDSIWIDRVEYRTITKTVTIRDTTIVTDKAKERILQKEISLHLDEQIKLKKQIFNIEADLKAMKKERNKWRLLFFLLLTVVAGWFLRKPLLKLISPIKL